MEQGSIKLESSWGTGRVRIGGKRIAYLSPRCPHQVFSASGAALSSVCGLVDDLTVFWSSFLQGNRHIVGAAILYGFSHLAYKVMGSNRTSPHTWNKARAYIVLICFPP